MTKRVLRGVQEIRTRSGSVDDGEIPYKAYMKLSILEMEKFRRGKERKSALDRIHHIDQRFQDIEVERQKIIAALESKGIRRLSLAGMEQQSASTPARPAIGPFKIRY
jgi:hypothetical protein